MCLHNHDFLYTVEDAFRYTFNSISLSVFMYFYSSCKFVCVVNDDENDIQPVLFDRGATKWIPKSTGIEQLGIYQDEIKY
jgi:hypothetical protein